METPLFKIGAVVHHRSNSPHKIVILKVRKRLFNRWYQTYLVNWYNDKTGEYCTSSAFEHELKNIK